MAETGYWIGPDGRGHGYVTEAVREVARYVFGLGFHRLELVAADRQRRVAAGRRTRGLHP